MVGMTRSVITALGCTSETFSSAARPSGAVSTSYPQAASNARNPSSDAGSSSATTIRAIVSVPAGAIFRGLGRPPLHVGSDGNPRVHPVALPAAGGLSHHEVDGSLSKLRPRHRSHDLDGDGRSPHGNAHGGNKAKTRQRTGGQQG